MTALGFATIAAVALVGMLNLFLLVNVIRRLGEHDDRLGAVLLPSDFLTGLKPGSAVPSFSVTAIDGYLLTDAAFHERTVTIGFFDVNCRTCLEQAPMFNGLATLFPDDSKSIAFVCGGPAEGTQAQLLERLTDVDHICTEETHGSLARVFEVDAFPAFTLVRDGTVQLSCPVVDQLASELGGI